MTQFLDVRIQPVGGELARAVCCPGHEHRELHRDACCRLLAAISRAARADRDTRLQCGSRERDCELSNWGSLLQLPPGSAFVGLLWPGDSMWAHGLDYPGEARVADDAGALVAAFIDANFQSAASVSFASHSLGARVVLATISKMTMRVRRLTLMAGAIDDDCLTTEFAAQQTISTRFRCWPQ